MCGGATAVLGRTAHSVIIISVAGSPLHATVAVEIESGRLGFYLWTVDVCVSF